MAFLSSFSETDWKGMYPDNSMHRGLCRETADQIFGLRWSLELMISESGNEETSQKTLMSQLVWTGVPRVEREKYISIGTYWGGGGAVGSVRARTC